MRPLLTTAGVALIVGAALQAQAPARAVIAGRVWDDYGDPVIGAHVVVETSSGDRGPAVVAQADTDDRGEYRIPLLPPGRYRVAATTAGAISVQTTGSRTMLGPETHKIYFPGTNNSAEAEEIALAGGGESDRVDFVVPAAQAALQPFSVAAGGGEGITVGLQAPVSHGGDGVIRGRVVALDGRILPYAQVGILQLVDRRRMQEQARADARGAFEFRDLPPGEYRVVASKAGYEPIVTGAPPMALRIAYSGRSVTIAAGRVPVAVDIPLAPLATLNGAVRDADDQPLAGVAVQLLQLRYEAGRRQFVPAGLSRMTDDLGRYRLFGLAPGTYLVRAVVGGVRSADVSGYLQTFYPSTSNAGSARLVAIKPSDAVVGVDVTMVRGRTARLSGQILDSAGTPNSGGSVSLRPSQRSSAPGVSAGARLTPGGGFEFPNVPPGEYVIQVDRGKKSASTEGEFGALPVAVNGADLANLVVQTSSGSAVAGVVRFETSDASKRASPTAVSILALPIDYDVSPWSGLASAEIGEDGRFAMSGLHGPRRIVVDRWPEGWALQEIRANGIDITDRPIALGRPEQSVDSIEVILTDRVTRLSGRVTDGRGEPATGAAIVVFSVDRDRWFERSRYVRTVNVVAGGSYEVQGLPAGAYYVAALPALPNDGGWQDPAYLEALRFNATTVPFSSEARSVDFRLGR